MPSTISHLIAGSSLGYSLYHRQKNFRFWFAVFLLAAIADFDVIAFKLGIKYSHPFGHRGFFHSILFALILGLLSALIMVLFSRYRRLTKEFWYLAIVFFIIAASHPILDMITNGGLGIGLFIPFDNRRYFFSWRPIEVSPIGIKNFFGNWGLRVLKNEFIWIIIPSLFLIGLTRWIKLLLRKKYFYE